MNLEQIDTSTTAERALAQFAELLKVGGCEGELRIGRSFGEALVAEIAAITPPEAHVVVTRNEAGQAVAVTRQDDEGRILSVIAEFGYPQWQPIETAPKTTRSILVWCPERQNQYMVYWDDRYEGEWRTVGGSTSLTESPTHWQPMPARPEVP